MAQNEVLCGLCSCTERDHVASNHEFSVAGQLIPKRPEEKPKPPVVRVTADLVLRQALVLKGLLTESDLIAGEVLLNELIRDSANRSNSGSSGSNS